MLGKTHHAGGTVAALVAFEVMRKNGWLIPDCNAFVQLLIMYPFASFGSIFSDLDQGDDSIPSKDPIAIGIHKVLKMTGAKHRSWQTHSILFTGSICLLLFTLVFIANGLIGVTGSIDWACLRLSTIGFICGVASHLILDAFTTAGIHLYPGFKIRFVPKTPAFATGGTWEKIVFYVLIACIIFLVGRIFVVDFINWLKIIAVNNEILNNLLNLF